jgi:hypothetical protein
MSRLSVFAVAAVLSTLAVASSTQIVSAKEHHHVRKAPQFTTEQFRNANAAVVVLSEAPSSMYTGGWSAPAGH